MGEQWTAGMGSQAGSQVRWEGLSRSLPESPALLSAAGGDEVRLTL
jgi:hypothetical protein